MENKSSNKLMNETLDILHSIHKLDPPPHLLEKILLNVERQKPNLERIDGKWLGFAAALLICLMSLEIYFIYTTKQQKEKQQIVQLMGSAQNNLYHE
jgi:hypothetical protein